MTSSMADIRDSIRFDYRRFKGMDSEGPYRFAGHGKSEFASCYPSADKNVSVSWEPENLSFSVKGGVFEEGEESHPLGEGEIGIEGDVLSKAVFNRGVYLFPRDRLFKAVGGCYSHKAFHNTREKEFWTNMLLNYLRCGELEVKKSNVTGREPNANFEKAVTSAKTLGDVWERGGDHRYMVALSGIDPFLLASPQEVEIGGEYGFCFSGNSKRSVYRDKTNGRLLLRPETGDYGFSVFKIPCLVRSGSFQMPNRRNDIARTDGIRKRKPTLLRGEDIELYIDDASVVRRSFDYKDVSKDLFWDGLLLSIFGGVGLVVGAAVGGLVSLGIPTLNEVTSWFKDVDYSFGGGFRESLGFWTPLISGAFGVGFEGIGLYLCKRDRIGFVRKLKGNPSMSYWARGVGAGGSI
jgi:hypothetical protein